MPKSVTRPVTCVVRISALGILVMTAFCSPMMKHSSSAASSSSLCQITQNQVVSQA